VIELDMSDFDQFAKMLDAEAAEASRRVERAVVAQQMVILARAKADAPQRTGKLKADIRGIGRRGLSRRVRAGKKRTFYSKFQEQGTSKMAAHPFLLKQANSAAQAEFEKRVQVSINLGRIYR
jgi:HK97 gp10 family phage protein